MTHLGHSGKVLFMRIFILVLVLIFGIQSCTKADDIRDFEIEGFTIGGNLLDHFNRTKIQSEKFFFKDQKDNKKYASIKIYEELKVNIPSSYTYT